MISNPLATTTATQSANALPLKTQLAAGTAAQGFASLIADPGQTSMAVTFTMQGTETKAGAAPAEEGAQAIVKSAGQNSLPGLLEVTGETGENLAEHVPDQPATKPATTQIATPADAVPGKPAVQANVAGATGAETQIATPPPAEDEGEGEGEGDGEGKDQVITSEKPEEPTEKTTEAATEPQMQVDPAENAPVTENPNQPVPIAVISPDAARQRDAMLKDTAAQEGKSAVGESKSPAKETSGREQPSPARSVDSSSALPVAGQSPAARLAQETEVPRAAADKSAAASQIPVDAAASGVAGTSPLQSHRNAETPTPVISARPGRFGEELGVAIARHASQSREKPLEILTLRLDPPEHGRIEVRLTFEDGAPLRASVLASQPGTLDLLRRDSADLMRALSQNGIGTDAQSFQFDSRGQNTHQERASMPQMNRHNGRLSQDADGMAQATPTPVHYRPLRGNGAVNLIT